MLSNPLFDPTEMGPVFDESDRLVADGAIRLAGREGGPPDVSSDLYRGLLILAKAMRHGHAAIDLADAAFSEIVEELWVVRGDDGDFDFAGEHLVVADIVGALIGADERLIGRSAMESTEVEAAGSPLLISTAASIPRFVTSRRFAAAECAIAGRLLHSAEGKSTSGADGRPLPDPEVILGLADPAFLNEEVRSFVKGALTRQISVLTGGPGTGKTTAIATMLRAMGLHARSEGISYRIALCAPTAKAAVRMREAIEAAFGGEGLVEFETELEIEPRSGSIHRLLNIRPDSMSSDVELACDLVIVDEVSMLELSLMDQLLRQAGSSHVLLVGDPDQLASVDVGAVLSDVVAAGSTPGAPLEALITRLTTYHRGTPIVAELATAVNSGDFAAVESVIAAHPESLRLATAHADEVAAVVETARAIRAAASAGEVDEALDLLSTQAVLCANRKGDGSVSWWQEKVSSALKRPGTLTKGGARFAVGTPIMVLKNEQSPSRPMEDRLSNGDVGVVVETSGDAEAFFLPASDSPRHRSLHEVDQAVPAWAFTIHKSQGSEYEQVVVSLPARPNRILSRELLYTAVTRAKHGVVIIGSREVVAAALSRRVERVSGLTERLLSR